MAIDLTSKLGDAANDAPSADEAVKPPIKRDPVIDLPTRPPVKTRWQDIDCSKCGKRLTDSRNAIVVQDHISGGFKGVHKECPTLAEAPDGAQKVNVSPDYAKGWNDAMALVSELLTGLSLPVLIDHDGKYALTDAAVVPKQTERKDG